MNIGRELLDVPFPEMVTQLGVAIAESQLNLDRGSIAALNVMSNAEAAPVTIPIDTIDSDLKITTTELTTSMVGAGFQPTFYQFAETIIEVKMAISMSQENISERTTRGTESTVTVSKGYGPGPWGRPATVIRTTPVDAKYSSKYNYNVEGSSILRTRLVPVPPNTFMQRMLDLKAEMVRSRIELDMRRAELAVMKAAKDNEVGASSLNELEQTIANPEADTK